MDFKHFFPENLVCLKILENVSEKLLKNILGFMKELSLKFSNIVEFKSGDSSIFLKISGCLRGKNFR